MKQVLTIAALILTITCLGQERSELRHCKTKEFKYDFYVQLSDKNVRYKDTVLYSWFRAQKIHTTQGMSDGYLLNGPFKKYYHSGQIAEQGEYKNGLKTGEWKSWRESGTLIAIYHYVAGQRHGTYSLFGEDGRRTKTGSYKKGNERIEVVKADNSEAKKKKFRLFKKKENSGDTEVEKPGRIESRKEKKEKSKSGEEKEPFFKRLFRKKEKREGPKLKDDKPEKEKREKKSKKEEVVIEEDERP